MATIELTNIIPGARSTTFAGASPSSSVGLGPYTSPGVPASGYLNNVAQKGALVVNTATGIWYANTGTLAATTYTVIGAQV